MDSRVPVRPSTPEASDALALARALRDGDRRALSRLLSLAEAQAPAARAALRFLHPSTGRAHVVGITGPPGAGKSTLVSRLIQEYRRRGLAVGVLAVDPTSPYSGGALLGDRIRMLEHHADPDVFVRSMATRGAIGGLARTTMDAVLLLDAAGKDVILIETVGVGQDEVEIARAADTVLVVEVPGLGDDVQALKAGLLETADVLVLNKADQPGAERRLAELRALQSLAPAGDWEVPILPTVATAGEGIPELVDAADRHRAYLRASGRERRRRADQAARQVRAAVEEAIDQRLDRLLSEPAWQARLAAIGERQEDPYAAADQILTEVLRDAGA